MQIYLAGTDVHIIAQFTDRGGNFLPVISAQYRVNNDREELLPMTDLPIYLGQENVEVTVPASVNDIAAVDLSAINAENMDSINVRELRTIEFLLTLEDQNTVLRQISYALEPADVLIVGLNSFQTLKQGELNALDIPNLTGWNNASAQEKVAAMVEARLRICRLRFTSFSRGQNYLSEYAPIYDLALIPPSEFVRLPIRLLSALNKAQIAEANAILGNDPIEAKRRSGLISETIGESSETYRVGKVIELPVTKQSLSYLGGFISFSKPIGRA